MSYATPPTGARTAAELIVRPSGRLPDPYEELAIAVTVSAVKEAMSPDADEAQQFEALDWLLDAPTCFHHLLDMDGEDMERLVQALAQRDNSPIGCYEPNRNRTNQTTKQAAKNEAAG